MFPLFFTNDFTEPFYDYALLLCTNSSLQFFYPLLALSRRDRPENVNRERRNDIIRTAWLKSEHVSRIITIVYRLPLLPIYLDPSSTLPPLDSPRELLEATIFILIRSIDFYLSFVPTLTSHVHLIFSLRIGAKFCVFFQ